jgi:hypothetical protein
MQQILQFNQIINAFVIGEHVTVTLKHLASILGMNHQ